MYFGLSNDQNDQKNCPRQNLNQSPRYSVATSTTTAQINTSMSVLKSFYLFNDAAISEIY